MVSGKWAPVSRKITSTLGSTRVTRSIKTQFWKEDTSDSRRPNRSTAHATTSSALAPSNWAARRWYSVDELSSPTMDSCGLIRLAGETTYPPRVRRVPERTVSHQASAQSVRAWPHREITQPAPQFASSIVTNAAVPVLVTGLSGPIGGAEAHRRSSRILEPTRGRSHQSRGGLPRAGAVQWLESWRQATNEGCPMTMTDLPPTAIHRGEKELPFVDIGDGATLQLLQVDLSNGVWIVRNHFPPDTTIQTHKHTGHVLAFTQKGSWFYKEYPDVVNTAGSYLYEPAGSIHTLHVPATNKGVTDVWF